VVKNVQRWLRRESGKEEANEITKGDAYNK
jgi:hypothetical protein